MQRFSFAAVFLVLTTIPAFSSDGKLDENGCHYDRKKGGYHCHEQRPPNPDRFAPVKKSRDNVCLDKSSPNYRTLRHFVAYRDMLTCVGSGGREPDLETGGLRDKPW